MKKRFYFCGRTIDVTVHMIDEREVPYYIRHKLDNGRAYYIQNKRDGRNIYFCRREFANARVRYYSAELPFSEGEQPLTA